MMNLINKYKCPSWWFFFIELSYKNNVRLTSIDARDNCENHETPNDYGGHGLSSEKVGMEAMLLGDFCSCFIIQKANLQW